MMGKTHAVTGVAAYLALAPHSWPLAGAAVCGAAALLPDLDHPRSIASNCLGPLSMAVSWVVCKLWHHRGETHTVPAVLAVYFATLALAPAWAAGAMGLGYAMHLVGDLLTKGGIMVWWPLSRVRVAVPVAGRTGSGRESAIAVLAMAATLVFAVTRLPI